MTNEEDFICAGPASEGIQTNTRHCLMLKLNENEQGYTGTLNIGVMYIVQTII
jgi:hypothetical protein